MNFLYCIVLQFLLSIVTVPLLYILTSSEASAATKDSMTTDHKADTLPPQFDRHPLISAGGGYFSNDKVSFSARGTIVATLELEYPLDRNRDWNLDVVYYHLFYNSSGKTDGLGILSFRRYLLSQENTTRPSVHIGLGSLSIDLGAAIDITILKRLLFTQLCLRVPVQIPFTYHLSGGMPTMLTLNARVML